MHASRLLIEPALVAEKRELRILSGSNTLPARKMVTQRDGRIRLVRETTRTDEIVQDEPAVARAHARLRLPSLEQWLSARVW